MPWQLTRESANITAQHHVMYLELLGTTDLNHFGKYLWAFIKTSDLEESRFLMVFWDDLHLAVNAIPKRILQASKSFADQCSTAQAIFQNALPYN